MRVKIEVEAIVPRFWSVQDTVDYYKRMNHLPFIPDYDTLKIEQVPEPDSERPESR